MKIFEAQAAYVPEFPGTKTLEVKEYNYENERLGVIATDKESAEKKFVDFLVGQNKGTKPHFWEMIELVESPEETKEISPAVKTLILMGVNFIDINLPREKSVFVTKMWYDRTEELRCSETAKKSPYEYEGVRMGIVARGEEQAKMRFVCFMVAQNPETSMTLWDFERFEDMREDPPGEKPREDTIEETVEYMRLINIEFIGIDIFMPGPMVEVELIEGEDPGPDPDDE